MKRTLFLPVAVFLLYLVFFSEMAASGARKGLLLWYHSVIPVLLPFMFTSSLILRFRLLKKIPAILTRPLRKMFHCSQAGCFAVITGFLCGFPIGAKTAYDLKETGQITSTEYQFLIQFVNNVSPGFLISYLAVSQMEMPDAAPLFLLNILGASMLYGFLLSFSCHRKDFQNKTGISSLSEHTESSSDNIFSVIDLCINDSMQNTLRLGGYMILFSVIAEGTILIPGSQTLPILFLRANLELTNGISILCTNIPDFSLRFLLTQATASFGGLSALLQTAGICHMNGALLLRYIKSRVIITLLSILLSVISLLFCQFFL